MSKTKLGKAVAAAIAGTALSVAGVSTASAAAITMYNTYNAGAAPGAGGTDGWVYGFQGAPSAGVQGGFVGINGSSAVSTSTPFGYASSPILNWGVEFESYGSAVVSTADSVQRYGVAADIDVGQGTWSDASRADAAGWKHNLDIGLIQSDRDLRITLSVKGLDITGTDFGFTILKGMSSATDPNVAYGHHGAWNANQDGTPLPGGIGFTNADIVKSSLGVKGSVTSPVDLNTISFDAQAGQVYTVLLGGYRNGAWSSTVDGYVLSINAVPEPASLSLFGIAFTMMGASRRRKKANQAA